jgi:HSP20 family molecular chaperone IbpA
MNRLSGLSSPFLLGFDEIERALERLTKVSGDGYPPYNIERIAKSGPQAETLRITLAVAGFGADDLEVTVEENQLVIRGRQAETPDRVYLHRGIAARQFQKTFLLAEGIEVRSADLKDGLLEIDLVRPTAERIVRRIKISGRANEDGSKEVE